ncbi:hypothetical protein EAX61_15900 [Dokdonia sinensis]|uniref:Uncharacterized protein n=1 Tax=Dokdonia sinensis TaxID=2479847 RepID=A0A3M0FVX5_9FLAO|nr:hypothetical protein [Dokdonia sinensis]RMB56107.1 hypothetical protein EAX61_15900 [Dokdonia sinensis]
MTSFQKKQKIKDLIDNLDPTQLDQADHFLTDLQKNETRAKEYITKLLKEEENLFKRLAQ